MKATYDHELVKRMIDEAVKAESKKAYLEGLDSGIKAEREACAKLCEEYAIGLERNYSEIIADKIRARGKQA